LILENGVRDFSENLCTSFLSRQIIKGKQSSENILSPAMSTKKKQTKWSSSKNVLLVTTNHSDRPRLIFACVNCRDMTYTVSMWRKTQNKTNKQIMITCNDSDFLSCLFFLHYFSLSLLSLASSTLNLNNSL
jgi:hypothetical protein